MIKIDSISELHNLLGCEKPKHPLVSVIDFNSIVSSFYATEY